MSQKDSEIVNEQNEEKVQQPEQENIQPVDEKVSLTDELQAKLIDLNDKYLRLYSDFDNFRKRTAKEKVELMKSAGEDIFVNLLPVIDDFDRAIKSNAEITDVKVINDGINLIYNKFKNSLIQKGLEEMKSMGESFNTDLHEAITSIPAPSEDLKGKVVDELEKGYLINGKVVRFAKVVIGN